MNVFMYFIVFCFFFPFQFHLRENGFPAVSILGGMSFLSLLLSDNAELSAVPRGFFVAGCAAPWMSDLPLSVSRDSAV